MASAAEGAEAEPAAEAVTTAEPYIPTDELALMLVPLTKSELLTEAGAWQELAKAKAVEIAKAEIAVKRQNAEIENAEEIAAQADEAEQELERLGDAVEEAESSGDAAQIAEAEAAAREAEQKVREVAESVEDAEVAADRTAEIQQPSADAEQRLEDTARAADRAERAVADVGSTVQEAQGRSSAEVREIAHDARQDVEDATTAAAGVADNADELAEQVEADSEAVDVNQRVVQETADVVDEAREAKEQEKVAFLETTTELRAERTQLLDNLRAVVDDLEGKTDPADSTTLSEINDYRLYMAAVSGINLDVSDTTSTWIAIKGWLASDEGGLRWAKNLGFFLGILIASWFVAGLASALVAKSVARVGMPVLLKEFLIRAVHGLILLVGLIWAISALEVSLAPLLAIVGAAGFIIAFAMQDSLSNFASGLMILMFRPFDVGDLVEAGGVAGTVSSMNLVSTTIRTPDNKLMVVPNNKILSDVITNATGVSERRVDLVFGIGYTDDIDRAQAILEEIVTSHPLVLEDPEPVVRLHELAASSVNFVCRPWVRPDDYWPVYWDITRTVKARFDDEDIAIPFPQQDVHLHLSERTADGLAELVATVPESRGQA